MKIEKKVKRKISALITFFNNFLIYRVTVYLFKIFPLKNNRVLFISDSRKELGGNLRFIYDYIKDMNYDIKEDLIKDTFHKRNLKQTINLIKNITTSKYIFIEDWTESISKIKPRKNQEYVQLWHAAGAFKKFGNARLKSNKTSKNTGHQYYTKAIVSSEEIRKCYADSYGIPLDNVKATGIPRTDIFFDDKYKEKVKKEFFQKYPELKNKKLIIFAPTLRTFKTSVTSAYYDFEMLDLEYLKNHLGDEYKIILKWHPFVYNKLKLKKLRFNFDKYKDFVYDLSSERDINDLLIVSDLLITDYSSVIFDYYLLNKPVVYYTYDLDKYANSRGFYYDFEDYIYGNKAFTIEELISCIKDEDLCNKKRKKFGDMFMSSCNGKSTENVYKYIFENNNKK